MAVKVREGLDYRILNDDYRKEFHKHNNPVKTKRGVPQYRCIYCGDLVPLFSNDGSEFPMEVDHIIPKTRMGAGILWNPNKGWNLGASCKSCNTSKSNKIDYRVVKGYSNKMKYRYRLGVLANTDELSTEANEEPSKWLTVMIVALIATITLLSPIALVASWVLQGAWALVVRVKKLMVRSARRTGKKVHKSIKKKIMFLLEIVVKVILSVYIALLLKNYVVTREWDFITPARLMYSWALTLVRGAIAGEVTTTEVVQIIFN